MTVQEVLTRIGIIRNKANLSARELSLRIGMSAQYISKIESRQIVLTIEKLFDILTVCECSPEKFFASNFEEYEEDKELTNLIKTLPLNKKKNIIEFIKK